MHAFRIDNHGLCHVDQLLCFSGEINVTNFSVTVDQNLHYAIEETRLDKPTEDLENWYMVSGSGNL